jgi:short-subunit dehydrogenase
MSTHHTQGTALITGASSGIGAVYADRLAARGYDLLLVARDRERLDTLAAKLAARDGVRTEILRADLSNSDHLKKIEQRLAEDHDITMLVNNAGIAVTGPFIDSDIDRTEAMIKLNVIAPTRLAHAAAKRMAGQGSGTIINIGSVVAMLAERFAAGYSATKAYVLSLSQTMEAELKGKGVRIQAVLPGTTRTEIWERAGMDVNQLPEHMLMDVGDMVDAALAGLDLGEFITIPALPDMADWERYTAARHALAPNLNLSRPAPRYLK